jgi:Domain of unknown function (DUF1902)
MTHVQAQIMVRTAWDGEAHVWVAVADGRFGLATEAESLDARARLLPGLALELLEDEISQEPEIELIKLDRIYQLFDWVS